MIVPLVLTCVVMSGLCSAQFVPGPTPVSPAPAAYYKPSPSPVHPQNPYAYAAILRQSQDVGFDGSFNYAYETENGISSQASGVLQNPGTEVEAQVMSGSYSYTAPDGTPITVNWVADENGFRAEGAHIPQASPEISRSVQYNLAQPQGQPIVRGAAPIAPAGAPILAGGAPIRPAFRYPTTPAVA